MSPTDPQDRLTDLTTRLAVVEHALQLRMEAAEKALQLQATEYGRRLDYLNGEADRLRAMQSTYVPREVWDAEHKRLLNSIDILNSFRDTSTGRNSVLTFIISMGVSLLVGLAVHIWSR